MDFSKNSQRTKFITGGAPPTKRHVNADGTITIEKLNPIPCKCKMVDPQGVVAEISLATGFGIRNPNNEYGAHIMAEKLRKGWLRYDECPLAAGRIPAGKDKPCTSPPPKGECCAHLQRVIDARKAANTKTQEEVDRRYRTDQDRMLRLLEEQARQVRVERESDGKLKF